MVALVAIDQYRCGCNIHKDRGATVCAGGLKVRREAVDRRLVAWTPHRGPSATKKARLNDLSPIRSIAGPNAVDKHGTIQDSWHIANQSHIVCL